MDEQVVEFLSWVLGLIGSNLLELFALGFSAWALCRTFRTDKRDLLKERDDLLKTTIETKFKFFNAYLHLLRVPHHLVKSFQATKKEVFDGIIEITDHEKMLRENKPTATRIDDVRNKIDELHIQSVDTLRYVVEEL